MRRNFTYKDIKFSVIGKFYNDGDFPKGYYTALYFDEDKNAWCRIQQIKEVTILNTRYSIIDHIERIHD